MRCQYLSFELCKTGCNRGHGRKGGRKPASKVQVTHDARRSRTSLLVCSLLPMKCRFGSCRFHYHSVPHLKVKSSSLLPTPNIATIIKKDTFSTSFSRDSHCSTAIKCSGVLLPAIELCYLTRQGEAFRKWREKKGSFSLFSLLPCGWKGYI